VNADLLSSIGSISSAVAALVATVIAIFAWKASQNSAKATELLTQIERMRLHGEILPQIDARIDTFPTAGDRLAVLQIRLAGPQVLVQLDGIELELRSLHLIKKSGETRKYYTEIAWPFQIVKDGPDGPLLKRATLEGPIVVGESRTVLVATPPEYLDDVKAHHLVVPASLTCTKSGFQPWTVPVTLGRDENPNGLPPGVSAQASQLFRATC
jgi:hypothetical protein